MAVPPLSQRTLTLTLSLKGRGNQNRHRRRRAFTLVEVLAALMLITIVLPTAMEAITLSVGAADAARYRNVAAGLAESKLNELVTNNLWQNGNQGGDFGTAWPNFRWQLSVQPWAQDTTSAGLQQLDLEVLWTARNREESLTVSTLSYVRNQ
jgi:prepilin-type N-terminal cleavage/methylation domain-containing protein